MSLLLVRSLSWNQVNPAIEFKQKEIYWNNMQNLWEKPEIAVWSLHHQEYHPNHTAQAQ